VNDFYSVSQLRRCELLTALLQRFSQHDVLTPSELASVEVRSPEQVWAEICQTRGVENHARSRNSWCGALASRLQRQQGVAKDPDISVAMRGTCFRVRYRKQEAPWLVAHEYGPDDPGARVTLSEFRALAWAAANAKARELGWIV